MTCHDVNRLLDNFVDGLVSGHEAEEIEQHLMTCQTCQAELASIRSLRDRAAALPKHIAPGRDLWPGIAMRLRPANGAAAPITDHPGRFGRYVRRGMLAVAAAACVWLALASVYRQVEAPSTPTQHGNHVSNLEAELAEADRAYVAAMDELLAVLSDREPHLSPETAQVVRENLAIIDHAVRETRQALDEDPSNKRLARLLIATRQQGIDLIRQAVSLPDAS